MQENEIFEEIGMARAKSPHAFIIGKLCSFIDRYIDSDCEVYPEEPVSEDRNDLVPDVLVTEWETHEPLLIVEVTDHRALSVARVKVEEKYLPRFPQAEIFILDYEKKTWYAYGPNPDEENPSYSELLDEELDDALNWERIEIMSGASRK